MAFALGSEAAQGIDSRGQLSASGDIEMYFANFDDYDRYKAETAHHVSYRLVDVLGNAYIVTIPQPVLDVATVAAQAATQSAKARSTWSATNSDTYDSNFQTARCPAPA